MKSFNYISSYSIALILVLCFFQCASTKQLDKEPPTDFQDVYYQSWNSGIIEGGSGVNVFINTMNTSVVLDSVYFRGKGTKLQININNSSLYVGRFTSIMNNSSENLIKASNMPFKLKDNECVISYLKGKNTHYYKILNIAERETINYPSTSSNRQ